MKVLELFAGHRSIGKAFEKRGHEVVSIDWDESFEDVIHMDVAELTVKNVLHLCGGVPDVVWASPDCTTYSVAAISHHRRRQPDGNLAPVSEYAQQCDETNEHVLELIENLKQLNPDLVYFIENPRGGFRKMWFVKGLPRHTVTYCQYGDTRMKPTDIWTNHLDPQFKPPCKNGDPCHERAPRGARTGTQGIKGHKDRSRIPEQLCEHIVDICE